MPEKVQRFSRVLVSRRPAAEQRRPGAGEDQGPGRRRRASSRSIRSGARPIRTSWPSATWPASRCWPTRRPTKAKSAVEALAGEPAAFEPRAIPAVVFTDPEIAWAGLTETEAKQQGRTVEVAQFPWAASGRAQADRPHRRADQVDHRSRRRSASSGCGIVGAGAGDLIAEAVLAIEMGCSVARRGRDRSIPIPRSARRSASPPKSTSDSPPTSTGPNALVRIFHHSVPSALAEDLARTSRQVTGHGIRRVIGVNVYETMAYGPLHQGGFFRADCRTQLVRGQEPASSPS